MDHRLVCLFSLLLLFGCSTQTATKTHGFVIFQSQKKITVELYKINQDNTFHSTLSSNSNKKIKLLSGKYFAQSDCGSKEFNIIKDQTLNIKIHHLKLVKKSNDLASSATKINCKVNSRQNSWKKIKQADSISVFDNTAQIKINNILLKPTELLLPKIQLHSLRVQAKSKSTSRYHIQNLEHNDSIISVELGESVMLPVRQYEISLHGSKKTITLNKNTEIETGELITKISSNNSVFYKKSLDTMKINNAYEFNIKNTPLAVLPGEINLNYLNDFIKNKVVIESNKKTTIQLETVHIQNNCPFKDTACNQNSFIHLVEKKSRKKLKRINSMSEFYILKKSNFLFTLNDSNFIFFKSSSIKNKRIKTSKLTIIPRFSYTKNKISDLVRLYPEKKSAEGSSKDLSFTTPTTLELVDGRYNLKHFINNTFTKNRITNNKTVYLSQDTTIFIDTFISRHLKNKLNKKTKKENSQKYQSNLKHFQKKYSLQTIE